MISKNSIIFCASIDVIYIQLYIYYHIEIIVNMSVWAKNVPNWGHAQIQAREGRESNQWKYFHHHNNNNNNWLYILLIYNLNIYIISSQYLLNILFIVSIVLCWVWSWAELVQSTLSQSWRGEQLILFIIIQLIIIILLKHKLYIIVYY